MLASPTFQRECGEGKRVLLTSRAAVLRPAVGTGNLSRLSHGVCARAETQGSRHPGQPRPPQCLIALYHNGTGTHVLASTLGEGLDQIARTATGSDEGDHFRQCRGASVSKEVVARGIVRRNAQTTISGAGWCGMRGNKLWIAPDVRSGRVARRPLGGLERACHFPRPMSFPTPIRTCRDVCSPGGTGAPGVHSAGRHRPEAPSSSTPVAAAPLAPILATP